jgi:AcrR family transcriptional regulator
MVTAQAPTRRDRVRAATISEIKQTARRLLTGQAPEAVSQNAQRLLAGQDPEAVSLRAIAREMGMTAPALYRYFGSREQLVAHVIADIFSELADDLRAAIDTTRSGGGSLSDLLVAACGEFRQWSLAHRPEFGLIFGSPLPAVAAVRDDGDVVTACAQKFGGTFLSLYLELWDRSPFPVPADDEIAPELRGQLAQHREDLGVDLPLGAVLTYLRCWVRLYGAVSLEVFGHMKHALANAGPLFDYTLADLAALVGLEYQPPGRPG